MGLLARMTENGRATTGVHSEVLQLRFQVMGWKEQYARQLAADAEANTQTLAQMERDTQTRQAEQKGA